MIEPVTTTITAKLIKSFVEKNLEKVFTKATLQFRQVVQNRIIEYSTEMAHKCSFLRTILHKENIEIEKIYFPLRLKSSKEEQIHPDKVDALFNKSSRIIIIGNGGSGKTTLMKYLYINSIKTSFKIPVMLNLRDFNMIQLADLKKKKVSQENVLKEELNKILLFNKVGISEEVIEGMYESGHFLFILDGYDEINYDAKDVIFKDIDDFVSRFSKNKFIITTRPHTDVTRLTNFHSYQMQGLSLLSDLPLFIKQQLFNNHDLANGIVQSLNEPASEKYRPLLTNPLFLILFINSYESYPKLPAKKSDFYWQVFDALFEKHETFSKSGYRRNKLSALKREDFEKVLNAFSFISYFQSQFTFKPMYLEDILRKIGKNQNLDFETGDFVEDLRVTLSLLIEEGNELFFVHRTLQEYFAAKYFSILNQEEKKKRFEQLARKQIKDTGHTFLLQLISELYPYEYSRFYIQSHLQNFFILYEEVFKSGWTINNDVRTCINQYDNLREVISYSSEIQSVVDYILKHNTSKYSIDQSHTNHIHAENDDSHKEEIRILTQMQTIYRIRAKLTDKIEEHFKSQSEHNQSFFDFALYSNKT